MHSILSMYTPCIPYFQPHDLCLSSFYSVMLSTQVHFNQENICINSLILSQCTHTMCLPQYCVWSVHNKVCHISTISSIHMFRGDTFVQVFYFGTRFWIIITSLFSTCRLYRDRQKLAKRTDSFCLFESY